MNSLTLPLDNLDPEDLLSEWRWLVPSHMTLHTLTALGDLFLRDRDDSVHWMDVAGGHLSRVADSVSEFEALLGNLNRNENWLMPHLVADLAASGLRIGPNQCYSYKKPPCLGGSFEVDNFEATDLSVHFGLLGQIHAQIKDLPPGTPVGKLKFK